MVVISEGTRRLLGHLFELEDLGTQRLKGHHGAGAGLGGASAKSLDKSLRSPPLQRHDHPGRPRRRIRIAATLLVEGKRRARPSRAPVRRGWYWKITSDGCVYRTPQGANASSASVASALRNTPTARFTPSSTTSNAPPAFRATTRCKRNSTNSTCFSDSHGHRLRTPRSSSKCCRCRTMDAIPCLNSPRGSAGQTTMDALVRQVEILSSSGPLLVIFEDAHWADPTSLELMGRLANHIARPSRADGHFVPA